MFKFFKKKRKDKYGDRVILNSDGSIRMNLQNPETRKAVEEQIQKAREFVEYLKKTQRFD